MPTHCNSKQLISETKRIKKEDDTYDSSGSITELSILSRAPTSAARLLVFPQSKLLIFHPLGIYKEKNKQK